MNHDSSSSPFPPTTLFSLHNSVVLPSGKRHSHVISRRHTPAPCPKHYTHMRGFVVLVLERVHMLSFISFPHSQHLMSFRSPLSVFDIFEEAITMCGGQIVFLGCQEHYHTFIEFHTSEIAAIVSFNVLLILEVICQIRDEFSKARLSSLPQKLVTITWLLQRPPL